MAINREKVKCIHCLCVPDEITSDHVIPKSWFSRVHSKDVHKRTAPACFHCNQELGKKEKLVSHMMWLCMPKDHPLRSELIAKVYRACGLTPDARPLPGLKYNERTIRKKYGRELISMTQSAEGFDDNNIFPGFGFHPEYSRSFQRVTKLNLKFLERVAEKVIRGLEYTHQGGKRYIESPYTLEIFFPDIPYEQSLEKLRNLSPVSSDGTNLIQRAVAPKKPLEPIYIIRLWDIWEIWGVVERKKKL